MTNYEALKTEVTTDPLALGYLGMTDQQVSDSLNDPVRPRERDIVSSHEVFEAIVPADYVALSAADKSRLSMILSMGEVKLSGANTRLALAGMFGAGTTRNNLIALQDDTPISRAQERGLGNVGPGVIAEVRK